MTDDKTAPRNSRVMLWLIPAGALLAIALLVAVDLMKSRFSFGLPNSTTVNHSVVVERVQKVAKLVSTETVLRDVIIYENTWYGSTKRSLVVVTGKVLTGIDLEGGAAVEIDENSRTITIALPQPTILGVEITELKTYDEQRGFWNPFTPSDRDRIFQLAREQLVNTSRELNVSNSAKQSATELLKGMFSTDGYGVEVAYR